MAPRTSFSLSLLLALASAATAACTQDSRSRVPSDGGDDAPGGNGGNGGAGGGGGVGGLDGGGAKKDGPPLGPWGGVYKDPSPDVGADPADKFGGPADPSGKPRLVYPLDQSMHPTNLSDITFQWERGSSATTLYRIRLENARGKYDYYLPCSIARCAYPMPEAEWLEAANANWDAEVTVTIAGTDGMGGGVQTSDPITLRFSPEPVRGGLYYWSTKLKGTYRLTFGAKKALPFITPGSPTNAFGCGGCHSVSRDGKMIAFTAGQGQGYLTVAPTADPTMQTVKPSPAGAMVDSALMALSPDGSRVLVSIGAKLVLRDTADGKVLATVDPSFLGSEKQAYFPEWSPDGKSIAVTLSDKRNREYLGQETDYDVGSGQIAILPYNDGAFGAADVIVPSTATEYHFYPSWSPDGKWIGFTSAAVGSGGKGSQASGGGDSTYNEPQARLRLVASTGGTVYDLMRATQQVGVTSTWPKFTPFVQAGGDVIFIAFNSKMDYGFLLENSKLMGAFTKRPQLWLFAIDLRRLSSGDPSTAPVWLPFQDVTQQNHLPYWTEVISCSGGTAAGGCGEGEECKGGICQKT